MQVAVFLAIAIVAGTVVALPSTGADAEPVAAQGGVDLEFVARTTAHVWEGSTVNADGQEVDLSGFYVGREGLAQTFTAKKTGWLAMLDLAVSGDGADVTIWDTTSGGYPDPGRIRGYSGGFVTGDPFEGYQRRAADDVWVEEGKRYAIVVYVPATGNESHQLSWRGSQRRDYSDGDGFSSLGDDEGRGPLVDYWNLWKDRWQPDGARAPGTGGSGPFDLAFMAWVRPNSPPVATNDALSTRRATDLVADVLDNDSDPDPGRDKLTARVTSGPEHGTLDGFTYLPDSDFVGRDSFTYVASDGHDESNEATVTIDVVDANRRPVGVDDQYSTPQDKTLTVAAPGVLANDTDPDRDDLTSPSISASDPANGDVALNEDGSFTYTPDSGFVGQDTFSYTPADQHDSDTATVTIDVTERVPVAVDDVYSTPRDTELTIAGPGVLSNDEDLGGATASSDPEHGTVALAWDGSFTYAPDVGFVGQDSFTYTAVGPYGSGTATVTINVTNRAPIAVDDAESTSSNTPFTLPAPGLLANDRDPDGDVLTTTLAFGPKHGSVTVNKDGSFTYTPARDFLGEDDFFYAVSDGRGASDVGRVNFDVRPTAGGGGGGGTTNHAPEATDDRYSTTRYTALTLEAPGVLGNDIEPDRDPMFAGGASDPAHGTLTLAPDGAFNYTPDDGFFGQDSFTYNASDDSGLTDAATVTIDVTNSTPVAADETYSTKQDTALTVAASTGVLANDTDADGDRLSAAVASGPSNGTLALAEDGSFTYTPSSGFNGTDSFTYKTSDGAAESAPTTVTIEVARRTYTFTGFFAPVDNTPKLNVAKAGSSIPVTFSLGGDKGLDILAPNSPASGPVACGGSADAIEQTDTSGSSGLSYDAATQRYKYSWKTNKAWAGTCRQFVLTLTDGTTHIANFQFK